MVRTGKRKRTRNSKLTPNFSFSEILAPSNIKTEPEQEQEEEQPEVSRENEPFVKVQVETSEYLDPLNLIHEEQFDQHIDKDASTKNRLTCGRIDVELSNETFLLKCNDCDKEFEIKNWQQFVEHIKNAHAERICTEKEKNKSKTAIVEREDVVDAALEVDIKLEVDIEDVANNDVDDSEWEPQTKKAKSTEIQNNKRMKSAKTFIEDSNTTDADGGLISFEHTSKDMVLYFLELINSHTILWHRRISIKKRYDEELSTFVDKFNEMFSKKILTIETALESIQRIKRLYQRITDPTHKQHIKSSSKYKTKYPKYFKLCDAIEENSKKITFACDKCRAFFFDEINLQIHKVKKHRIGELPYKCGRCNYGFSKPETLAEHEKKHERSQQPYRTKQTDKPVCEICGLLFETYYKYSRHKLRHEEPKEKCEICGKVYYEKWTLSEHMKSHRNERKYRCDICDKTFNHQSGVRIHKRGVHHVKEPKPIYIWVNKNQNNEDSDNENEQDSEINDDNDDSESSQNAFDDNHSFNWMK